MSELQISLIALGGVAVFGIWIYNKAQEIKLRRAAEKVFQGRQADALLPETAAADGGEPLVADLPESAPEVVDFERIEPTLTRADAAEFTPDSAPEFAHAVSQASPGEPAPDAAASLVATPSPVEAASEVPAVLPPQLPSAPDAEPPLAWCDPVADFIVTLRLAEAAHPATLGALLPTNSKPTRTLAQTASGVWMLPELYDQTAFRVFRVCLQLVDRRGAIDDEELNGFAAAMRRVAEKIGATAEMPDTGEMLVQARAIDEFCAQLDLRLSINVVDSGNGAFAGTKLRGLAESAGLQLHADGSFHFTDENGQLLFTLADLDGQSFDVSSLRSLSTHGVSFVLDVPRVIHGAQAFDRMLIVARQMATALGGQLANAQRAPLADSTIGAIRARIIDIQKLMAENQLPAGAERALRLFS